MISWLQMYCHLFMVVSVVVKTGNICIHLYCPFTRNFAQVNWGWQTNLWPWLQLLPHMTSIHAKRGSVLTNTQVLKLSDSTEQKSVWLCPTSTKPKNQPPMLRVWQFYCRDDTEMLGQASISHYSDDSAIDGGKSDVIYRIPTGHRLKSDKGPRITTNRSLQ